MVTELIGGQLTLASKLLQFSSWGLLGEVSLDVFMALACKSQHPSSLSWHANKAPVFFANLNINLSGLYPIVNPLRTNLLMFC